MLILFVIFFRMWCCFDNVCWKVKLKEVVYIKLVGVRKYVMVLLMFGVVVNLFGGYKKFINGM